MTGFIFTLILLGIAACGFLSTILFKNMYSRPGVIRIGLGIATLFMSVIALLQCFTIVPPGHRGVAVTFGSIDPNPISEGPHLIAPWTDIYHMNVQVRAHEEIYDAQTADTQSVGVEMIMNWRPNAAMMPTLYQEYGNEYASIIIPQGVQEALKAEIARHKITDLTDERPLISERVRTAINETLNQYNVLVVECGIGDIVFSERYNHAIEEKQQREQEALQKRYELERTQVEAQMAEAEAQGVAQARIARANAEAESVRVEAQARADALEIEAEAQANYNRQVADSLNDMLLRRMYLETWNGQLPTMMLGNEATTTMMLPITTK